MGTLQNSGTSLFRRSNEEFIGGDVEEEERDELADLPDGGVTGLLNPKLTTIDIRQVQ